MGVQNITSQQAPKAIGPYSQATISENLLFVSGQLPLVPETGEFVSDDIQERAHQVFKNMAAIAKEAGTALENVVKTTVFLTDLNDFQKVNEIYGQYFSEPFPARSLVQVAALPLGSNIEAEAIIKLK